MKVVYWQNNDIEIIKHPVTIVAGFFDSLHKGHKELVERAKKLAKKNKTKLAVLTFDKIPTKIIKHKTEKTLSSLEDRKEIFEKEGFDYFILINFTPDFSKKTPIEFIDEYLKPQNISHIVCGADFKFGHNGSGKIDALNSIYDVSVIPLLKENNIKVSTHSIMDKIQDGDIEGANKILVHPYSIRGIVIHGNHLGRKLGFPTANMQLTHDYIIPKKGVYLTKTEVDDKLYYSLTNIGYNPTINKQDHLRIETHIVNFDREIYDKKIKVTFLKYLRDEKKYNSKEELILVLGNDVKMIKKLLNKH